jgi:secernin
MCDTLVALGSQTDSGVTLFAKNSDRPANETQVLERTESQVDSEAVRCTHIEIAPSAQPTIGAWISRPAWCWGAEMGVNDRGVAIGNEAIYTTDDPSKGAPALIGMDLVRLGLQRGESAQSAVDEMVRLLERYGQGGSCSDPALGAHRMDTYWSSFLVADAIEAFVLETSGRTWQCAAVDRSEAISNRTILLPGHPKQPTAQLVDPRRNAGLAVLAKAPVSVGSLMAHLASHEGGDDGWTVCMHHTTPGEQEATTASLVAELPVDQPPRLWWAGGSPCVTPFQPVGWVGCAQTPTDDSLTSTYGTNRAP